jgi:quinohemoprotein ethanol dehydrogenase
VLVFRLDGKAALPDFAPPALTPAVVTTESFDAAKIAQGGRIFETTCGWCHGPGAISSGVLPDLRRSAALRDAATWRAIVIDGALADGGMASFSRIMTPADADAVRAYVQIKARALAKQE